jgi:hypothetical protein
MEARRKKRKDDVGFVKMLFQADGVWTLAGPRARTRSFRARGYSAARWPREGKSSLSRRWTVTFGCTRGKQKEGEEWEGMQEEKDGKVWEKGEERKGGS